MSKPIRSLFVLAGIIVLLLAIRYAPAPRFIYNTTPSFPTGVYQIDREVSSYHLNDLVYFAEPTPQLYIARHRGYLPARGNFMKRIGGLPGDEICIDAEEKVLLINGVLRGPVFVEDTIGRPLNPNVGCWVVPSGHFFPFSPYERSYDGRYLGAVPVSSIEGRLVPLFIQEEN